MSPWNIYFILVSCWFHSTTLAASDSHPIITLINAKWHRSPLQLEIIEYISEENSNWYWDYLEDLPSPLIGSEQQQYEKCIGLSKKYLGSQQQSLLKLSLSLSSLSPLIQAHLQIANELRQKCESDAFVHFSEKIICTPSDLKKHIENLSPDHTDDVETYSFDHYYPGSENYSRTAILYGLIGTVEFRNFHVILKKAVDEKKIKYVARHFIKNDVAKKLRLSGYGVELHLKSTEYKSQDDSPRSDGNETIDSADTEEAEVAGFDFELLKGRYTHLSHSLDRLRSSLIEKHDDIEPLKAWEFQELGLQAAQRIAAIQGEEALQILQFTAQNFPTQAKSLLPVVVSEDFKQEMKHNIAVLGRNLNLQPPDAALFVNGLFYDADTLDMATLLETLRSESRVLDGLHKIGMQGQTVNPLLALELSTSAKEFAIDIRDSSIVWINDLETDVQYKRWPSSLMDLLRPTFPGMMRNLRKNLYNLVLIVDPIKPVAREVIKLAESFVVHLAPLRLGFVLDTRPVVKNTGVAKDYRAINCAFNYVHQKEDATKALGFLTDIFASVDKNTDIVYDDVKKQLRKFSSKMNEDLIDDILGEDSDFDYGRQLSEEFIDRIGVKDLPVALLNGVPLSQATLTSDEFEETVLTEIMQQTPFIQKAVYKGDLSDSDVIVDYLMSQPHVMPRLNQRILSSDEPIYLDVSGSPHNDVEDINGLAQLSNSDLTATLISNLKYFGGKQTFENFLKNKLHFTTIWIVGDLAIRSTKDVLKSALNFMQSTNKSGVRVSFVPNVEGDDSSSKTDLNALVWSTLNSLSGDEALENTLKLLNLDSIHESDTSSVVKGFLPATRMHLKLLRVYCQRVLKLSPSANAIIVNGKVLGPLNAGEVFTVDDFNLLEKFNNHQYADKIRKALKESSKTDEEITLNSDILMKLIILLVPRQQSKSRFQIPTELQENHTVVNLPAKSENLPYFNIAAVLDPASKGAQKLAPVLILLRSVINCNLKLILCAIDKHSDMPVKNFYRFVVEPEIQFSAVDGKQAPGPVARFTGLPANTLLTQNLNVPENWLVEIVRSVYDLDNIKLIDINGPVHSEYELEYLLLEGHCFDTTSGAPPRGLQITLGTKNEPIIVDTIVMANLGYFQLKANPGAWVLKLRAGKSSDIYEITTAEGANTIHSLDGTKVVISSLKSLVLKLRVTKKPGMASADLLSDEKDAQSGIWDSITSSFGGGTGTETEDETINIFSVASGHLYERLLRIMMLSLLKHTKTPVKFWFLKNYLSPQFKDFLPHMAKEYNFQYELVQYKWPRWLHQQSEKQRTIWGYKILFLDVLFPLDVKKIIFVDADQIIRADLQELNTLDLGGAPYAYVPMGESRKEMEGFRFWKQGYWRNHLQGRRYHISALYVVDLRRFRRIAAGDRLRGQYQALSQDPNSLSNLDQDLPNNMIHQVAIKSLPQDWLWCETWCSTETLKTAKTIDLCNNPLTKEAKLTAAQRIVPEWKTYDTEIKSLMSKVEEELEHEHNTRHSEEKKLEAHTEL